ncbi:hypothetical protein [Burkholderia sp. Ac-20379]|uniref:hypothetical protein n=1 Tax=Burkholderia sp. Ac-20379 TaxID=2703900 RepID=UPI0019808CFD|nr:hypothetical protein [Burkholderia sp. Ac-20379]MBN3722848.1 hypothetical protein [Burkholderia sp. Ac-20379]
MLYKIFVAGWFAVTCFCADASADGGVVKLGGGTSNLTADGPASVHIRMIGCDFSMILKKYDHVQYNVPELIFYRANSLLPYRELPFLKQAETYSGYGWWFEEGRAENVPWIGFMCVSASDFKWSSDNAGGNDVTQPMQDIMDDNSWRCPADFDEGKWVRHQKSEGVNFENINVPGASGFVLDFISKNKNKTSRFCFVHEGDVLIGISGGDFDGKIGKNSNGTSLRDVLRTLEF